MIDVANRAHGGVRRPRDPAAGRGDGLRRQRSGRGPRGRPRHRRRQQARPPVRQGPQRRRRARGRDGRRRSSSGPSSSTSTAPRPRSPGPTPRMAEREAAKDRAALLDDKGDDANHADEQHRRDPQARRLLNGGTRRSSRSPNSIPTAGRFSSRRRTSQRSPSLTRVVGCFFHDVIAEVSAGLEPAYRIPVEHGAHPIWVIERDGVDVAVFNPGVGAPLATCCLEAVIGLGGTKIVICGGAGQLVSGFAVGHVVVPTSAMRDEGTSFHYLAPGRSWSRRVSPLAAIVARARCRRNSPRARTYLDHRRSVSARHGPRSNGACKRAVSRVEMEAAALFAGRCVPRCHARSVALLRRRHVRRRVGLPRLGHARERAGGPLRAGVRSRPAALTRH